MSRAARSVNPTVSATRDWEHPRIELPSVTSRARAALADPAEVAEFFGVSEKTLAQWRWRKIGPAFVKVGGAVRYRWDVIDAYVESRESAA